MYDCARNSLYGSEEKCEMEEIANDIQKSIRKDVLQSYSEKLDISMEVENYNSTKLKKVVPLIVKLKEEYSSLSELKERGKKLKDESKLAPENEKLKDLALSETEKYEKRMKYFIDEADKIIGVEGFRKLFEDKKEKAEACIDHVILLKTLKVYRDALKEQIGNQKESRKKTIMLLIANLDNEFDVGTGTEFIDFLKEDMKKYNKSIQKELKKYSLDKLKEVLLNLKLLTDVYGYNSSDITLEFILKEMESIKAKLKDEKIIYEDNSKYLKEISEFTISEIKSVLMKEVRASLERVIKKLKDEKGKLESILENDRKEKEILDIKSQQKIILEKIKKLQILKSSIDASKTNDENNTDLDKEIKDNTKKIAELNKKLDTLKGSPEEVLCNFGGIFGLLKLNVEDANKSEDKSKQKEEDKKSKDAFDDYDSENLNYDSEKSSNLGYTELESILQHYHLDINKVDKENNDGLSYEEFDTQLKYYQEKEINDIKKEEFLDVNLVDEKDKMELTIEEEIEKSNNTYEAMSEQEWEYKTSELLSDQELGYYGEDELMCKELTYEDDESISEQEWEYKTNELLSDGELFDTDEQDKSILNEEETKDEQEKSIPNEEETKDEQEKLIPNEEEIKDEQEKLIPNEEETKDSEKIFEEYIPMKEEEKKDIYIKLSDISGKLRNLEWRYERIDKALKSIKKKTKQYDKLSEKQEDRKDKIMDEIEKYEALKEVAESIEKGKDISYQLLYN